MAVYADGALSGRSTTVISNGYYHSCVVAAGSVFCWGNSKRLFKVKVRTGMKYRFQVAAIGPGGRGPVTTFRFEGHWVRSPVRGIRRGASASGGPVADAADGCHR